MRFTRIAERAYQLDKSIAASIAAGAINVEPSRAGEERPLPVEFEARVSELERVLSNLRNSVAGSRYGSQLEKLVEISNKRRQMETTALAESTTESLARDPQYLVAAEIFDREVQRLIGQIENRTSRTLEKTQIVTSAVQYGVIAFAFVLFMTWRQHSRYVEEEDRKEKHRLQLHKAKVAAEDANRIKSEFLANMSHEMRTPLTAIMGITHLCREAEECHDQLGRLGKIEKAAANLLKIVNDVLDLSKIEAGKLELEAIPFHIRDVLEQVRGVIEVAADDKNLTLKVECDENFPPVVGDPFRLNQVLINLASNALKFTADGEIVIAVRLVDLSDESIRAQCSVTDTGVGMTEVQVSKIFGMFAQADGSTTRKFGGTGLGLFICKKILDAMGSKIKVDSKIGQGSCFSFELELKSSATMESSLLGFHQSTAQAKRAEQQIVKHSVNIDRLISEDDDIVEKTEIVQNVTKHIEHLESLVDASLKSDLHKLPEELRVLTRELDKHLETFDSRSVDVFSQLSQLLDDSSRVKLRTLDVSIHRFDFVEARKHLLNFCESYGKSDEIA